MCALNADLLLDLAGMSPGRSALLGHSGQSWDPYSFFTCICQPLLMPSKSRSVFLSSKINGPFCHIRFHFFFFNKIKRRREGLKEKKASGQSSGLTRLRDEEIWVRATTG